MCGRPWLRFDTAMSKLHDPHDQGRIGVVCAYFRCTDEVPRIAAINCSVTLPTHTMAVISYWAGELRRGMPSTEQGGGHRARASLPCCVCCVCSLPPALCPITSVQPENKPWYILEIKQ